MWDVFRVSSDKLALCHLELMKKFNDLIRDINKYADEQVKIHRKVRILSEGEKTLHPSPASPDQLFSQSISSYHPFLHVIGAFALKSTRYNDPLHSMSICRLYSLCMFMCINQTKEEMVGTVEAVQVLQVQSGQLQKSKEGYHAKCLELDRLRKEGGPQKELEKVRLTFLTAETNCKVSHEMKCFCCCRGLLLLQHHLAQKV